MAFRFTSAARLGLAALLCFAITAPQRAFTQQADQQQAPDAKPDTKKNDKKKDKDQGSAGAITVTPTTGEATPAEKLVNLDPKAAEAAARAAEEFRRTEAQIMANAKPLRDQGRVELIRGLNAEFIWAKRTFPITKDGLTLKHGVLKPDGAELRKLVAEKGVAARPGDKGQITDILFKGNAIVLEINGGNKRKTKWWQRVQVGGGGGMSTIGPADDGTMTQGSTLALEFDKFVPELTVEQAKTLLSPVFDFSTKSALQSYTDSLPPKVKAALENHQVLVGMNRELVNYSKGRPSQKIREKDETGTEYEEWVYGAPPQQVDFVRFVKDEVVQVKTMTVDGRRLLKTEKEVDVAALKRPGAASNPETTTASTQQPGGAAADGDPTKAQPKKPSLRRPGEPTVDQSDKDTTIMPAPRPGERLPGQPPPSNSPLPMPPQSPAPGQPPL